jgi:hypothetical protein
VKAKLRERMMDEAREPEGTPAAHMGELTAAFMEFLARHVPPSATVEQAIVACWVRDEKGVRLFWQIDAPGEDPEDGTDVARLAADLVRDALEPGPLVSSEGG